MCSMCSTHSGLSIDTLVCLWFEILCPAETVMSQNNDLFRMRGANLKIESLSKTQSAMIGEVDELGSAHNSSCS